MGRFSVLCPVVAVVLSACSFDPIDDPTTAPPVASPGALQPIDPVPTPPGAPEVCRIGVWATQVGGAAGSQLAIAIDDHAFRATLVAMPALGGELRAFALDGRMDMLGDSNGTAIAMPGPFTQVAASSLQGHTLVGAVDGAGVELAMIDDPAAPVQLATLPGSIVVQPLILDSRDYSYVVTADDDTVMMTALDANLNVLKTKPMAFADDTITAIASAQNGFEGVTVFSTKTSCYVSTTAAFAINSYTQRLPFPCANVSVAAGDQTVSMAFEPDGNILTMPIQGEVSHHKPAVGQASATSPRIAFQQGHYWVGFLTDYGATDVGYVDEFAHIVSTRIDDEPGGNGMLQVLAGTVWSISLDPIALSAHQLCGI